MSTLVDDTRRTRPTRSEIESAAIDLIQRYGAQILSTARRYSLTLEDAEDAYQRALEIMLTKAPSTRESDLLPWLKTVVKHEAFALRRQRARHGLPTEHSELAPAAGHGADTHEQVERYERLQHGAEALRRLKPQEIRCMLLLAEGHSYAQIQEITGFSYTKVNRCLAEGRRSFLQRIDGIEAGAECERLAPLLSAYADREAGDEDAVVVRRHLRTCLACRASLREMREAPAGVAALAPIGAIAVAHGGAGSNPIPGIVSWLHDRLVAVALRGQDVIEMATAHKLAAVAASAAAVAGGGVATIETTAQRSHHRSVHVKRAGQPRHAPVRPSVIVQSAAPAPPSRRAHSRAHRPSEPVAITRSSEPASSTPEPQPAPSMPAPRPAPAAGGPDPKPAHGDGSGEFGP